MRKRITAVLAVLSLSALGMASAQTGSSTTPRAPSATAQPSSRDNAFLEKFVGTWTADPTEVRLVTDLDISVWGKNATSVRKVEMTIQPSGKGHIKVTRSVVDGRGKTKPVSVSVEEAQLVVRAPDGESGDPNRLEPVVEVQNPQRRYPDEPKDSWPLEGLVVRLVATDPSNNTLNLRFDLPDGRGSFGETLVRRAARATRTASH